MWVDRQTRRNESYFAKDGYTYEMQREKVKCKKIIEREKSHARIQVIERRKKKKKPTVYERIPPKSTRRETERDGLQAFENTNKRKRKEQASCESKVKVVLLPHIVGMTKNQEKSTEQGTKFSCPFVLGPFLYYREVMICIFMVCKSLVPRRSL